MIEFRFPSLGADMDTGKLVAWMVSPGDVVHRGDIVAEVETEKGLVEIECWDDGTVAELLVEPSQEPLRVGTVLALLHPVGVQSPAAPAAPDPEGEGGVGDAPPPTPAPARPQVPAGAPAASITPPVRHLAKQLGVDPATLPPGPDGTVRREDVVAAARRGGPTPRVSPRARLAAERLGVDLADVRPTRPDGLVTVDDVEAAAGPKGGPVAPPEPVESKVVEGEGDRVAAMRDAIARSMSRSKREIPHYYLGTRIDFHSAARWLEEENDRRPLARRLLPAALLLRATALALREVPDLNGHWVDGRFRRSDAVHLGVAVSLRQGGLVAPAIHDADRLDVDSTMDALRDVVARARAWRIRSSEMSDPTATVTNLGDRGVETVFPVIIPPQVAIVGFGRITDEPVAVDGMLAVHPVVHASLGADHRVTDGHRGGVFLTVIDRLLQEPQDL